MLALLAGGGIAYYMWYQQTHPSSQTSTVNGGGIQLDTAEKVETEDIQTALIIPKSTDKPGDVIKLSSLFMSAPKSWRTVNARNILNTPLQSVYAETTNDILTQLIMVPEQGPTDPLLATNSFSIYNITSWLGKPSTSNAGTVTPEAKAAYITNIENLSAGKSPDTSACKNGTGVLNTALCKDLLKPTPLTTNDGSLKGVAFLDAGADDTYDPQVIIFMTGKTKDQRLLAYGDFHLLDQKSHQLDASDAVALKAAHDNLAKGNIPNDTSVLYQHVVDAIKSIKLYIN